MTDRYQVSQSSLVSDTWRVIDTATGLNIRDGRAIRRFTSRAAAWAAANRLNTAKCICLSCRHKVLVIDTQSKVCLDCRAKGLR